MTIQKENIVISLGGFLKESSGITILKPRRLKNSLQRKILRTCRIVLISSWTVIYLGQLMKDKEDEEEPDKIDRLFFKKGKDTPSLQRNNHTLTKND